MKRWVRKHPVQAGLCITPWFAGFAAQALQLTPATSSPAVPAAVVAGQVASGAPGALAQLLWAPLLLIVLLSVGALALMIWRQNAQQRGRRRTGEPRLAARSEASPGAVLPAALALSSATMLVAPSVGEWPRDWPQAPRAPASDGAAAQRAAAEAPPILASAAKR